MGSQMKVFISSGLILLVCLGLSAGRDIHLHISIPEEGQISLGEDYAGETNPCVLPKCKTAVEGAYNNCRKMNGLMKGFNCVKSIIKVKECVTCVCSVIPKVCQRLKFAIG